LDLDDGFGVADVILSCVLRFVHYSELVAPYGNVVEYLARNFACVGFQKALMIGSGRFRQQ
jgi:hypothetical protein